MLLLASARRAVFGLLATWLLIFSLAGCQRAPYAVLSASRGAYRSPNPPVSPPATTLPALPLFLRVADPAIELRRCPSAVQKAHSVGRREGIRRSPRAVSSGAVAVRRQSTDRHQTVAKTVGDGFKKNPRKGLFWRLFWWGFFLTVVVVAVVGLTAAAPATAGGTVAMGILKDVLVSVPIVAAAAALLSLTIRLIWPHDPTGE